ncbi:MAG: hypothetical protein AUK48_12895 [Oscillatoriales cyanobacterium CG2_30_44_21]|nr:MAG: hypothetical protein AUK48_12895 [Oscillatoriales cyanobacterium CG2_30_44_21]
MTSTEDDATASLSEFIDNHPEFTHLPILDLEVFEDLRLSIDDDLVFSDLVTIYLDSAENLIEAIQMSLKIQDVVEFSISCHSLKSTSASIGARKLSYLCKFLEKSSKAKGIEHISQDYFDLVVKEYDLAIAQIRDRVISLMSSP